MQETSAVITIDDKNDASFRVDRNIQLRTGNRYFFGGECPPGKESGGGQRLGVRMIMKGGLKEGCGVVQSGGGPCCGPRQHFNVSLEREQHPQGHKEATMSGWILRQQRIPVYSLVCAHLILIQLLRQTLRTPGEL